MDALQKVVITDSQDANIPTYVSANNANMIHLDGRQAAGEGVTGSTVMSTGTIIGIAIAGSVILFGGLSLVVMRCLRSRYKQKKRPGNLDLEDDTEEDIIEALRSTRPPESDLAIKRPFQSALFRVPSLQANSSEETRMYDLQLAHPNLMVPPYAFKITGLRDSWPLIGWMPSASPQIPMDRFPVSNDKQVAYSAFPAHSKNDPTRPPRTLLRSRTATGLSGDWSTRRSTHSANSSITSLKRLSNTRRSISDNQLSTILRSTSQRLREAQRRPISRTVSVLSQVSGAPPALKAPSPPENHKGDSQEALIDLDDATYAESVRSSVLNANSQSPSPNRDVMKRKVSLKGKEKEKENQNGDKNETRNGHSPTVSEFSEPDSLCPSNTPDLFIPAPLSSPSKQRAPTNQRYKIPLSSTESSSANICEDENVSKATTGGEFIVFQGSSSKRSSNNDPFISTATNTKSNWQSLAIKSPPLELRQDVKREDGFLFKESENALFPLRIIPGNQQSPTKTKPPSANMSNAELGNPFHWSPQSTRTLFVSPGQKPVGIKQKGHKRRNTIRLSHLPRPVSVSVVLEEPENQPVSQRPQTVQKTAEISLPSPELSLPINVCQTNNSKPRPPSIPQFQPILTVPSSGLPSASRRSSNALYPATMSFYDYHSSPETAHFSPAGSLEPPPSPTPSMKKARRRGHNFSIDDSMSKDLALKSFASLSVSGNGISENQLGPTFSGLTSLELQKVFSSSQSLAPRLHGPRPPPPLVNSRSVTKSVSILRRMNSEVSTCSTASTQSRDTPTLPPLRNNGTSLSETRSRGTLSYLSIGLKTPSPGSGRERLQDLISTNDDTYNPTFLPMDDSNNENALGLIMPVVEHSPESFRHKVRQRGSSPLKSQDKTRAAQLRPINHSPIAQKYCQSCAEPLLSRPTDSSANSPASLYHDHCFVSRAYKQPTAGTHIIDKIPYYARHYAENKHEFSRYGGENTDNATKQGADSWRWSEVISLPLAKSVRHESQMEMPSPQGSTPSKMVNWRGSMGLYDEEGFLRSSPDRMRGLGGGAGGVEI